MSAPEGSGVPVLRPLVLAAHGTASEDGRRVVERCAAEAAALLGVDHTVGYVDVCGPSLEEALTDLDRPVVVPFFLASGYHVRQDVPSAVASAAPGATVTPALGDADEVVQALAARVLEAVGGDGLDAVVLTAAGSSVTAARDEVVRVSTLLGEALDVATGTAYLTGPGPRPDEEVARLRAAGHRRVVLASHLLSPGHFLDRAHAAAASLGTISTDALGTHRAVADLVVRRYRDAG
ncbi:sirohydrochlorin chelatase [Ornithinimicrobium tianjinense]|uniref:Cobalamin biosynthesis protein CbiX n=1 Tax=Ornithinimicrobium tianjinense TaxID=1195761 RepID=A0A917BD32_9MICO|nr:CbiX/SirB N-terminal domain-containing protein [Ornithinimicrobium tianjinense]GGF37795.1 cobalamin biosynthesis protein CbiX [Ornithinimicrobium tianjinense]